MSLLMQALKKAEHAKQKQSALAESDTDEHKISLPAAKEGSEFPSLNLTIPERLAPESPESRSSIPDAVRIEPPLSLSEIEPAHPAMALQMMALPVPAEEPADVQSSLAGHQAAASAAVETIQPGEPTPQPIEMPAQTGRPSTPRTTEEQKQAAVQAADKINQAQQKAKSVFASKQPPRSRRVVLFAGCGMIVAILCAGVGFYFWQTSLQDSGMGQNGMAQAQRPIPRPVANLAPTVAANPADVSADVSIAAATARDNAAKAGSGAADPASPSVASPALSARARNAGPSSSQASTALTPVDKDKPDTSGGTLSDASTPDQSFPAPRQKRPVTARQREQAGQVAAAGDIQIQKSITPAGVNSALTNAYRLFSSGDLSAARPLYENVLRDDPNNRDALLGMAAIAVNQKQTVQAGSLYSKLLDLDPSDPDAAAGLTSLRHGDPEQSESLLKKVLAQNPQSGATLFELGNLYAQQSRWADAQQSYFRAYGTAPGNADYAFNLAISLDRLSQNKLALEYYQRALALAKEAPGNFSRSAAQSRIDQLQQAPHEKHIE